MKKTTSEDSINLSPKYGVNPSLLHCFICGKETGIALFGKLKGDKEAPRDTTNPNEICDDCMKQIKAGNKFILECKDDSTKYNPVRTGRFLCIKGSAIPSIESSICYMMESEYTKLLDLFNEK